MDINCQIGPNTIIIDDFNIYLKDIEYIFSRFKNRIMYELAILLHTWRTLSQHIRDACISMLTSEWFTIYSMPSNSKCIHTQSVILGGY